MQRSDSNDKTCVTVAASRDGRLSRWVSTRRAAELLDLSETALRARLRRAAVTVGDVVFADLGGVTGTKLGRTWRIHFARML